MATYYFERALFVVGEPNSGKSTQLRSMFRDIRLGTGGSLPENRRLDTFYRLSNERCLYVRLTSPHEAKEALRGKGGAKSFLTKTRAVFEENTPRSGMRWNFAGALQPHSRHNMPGVVRTCRAFVKYFKPERTRVVFLSPDRQGRGLQSDHGDLVDRLLVIPSVEICWIDARDRTANGLLLADFFDFT